MNKKGFTLIELIAALIILILLFMLALVKTRQMIDSSRKKAVKASSIALVKATNDFVVVNNGTPDKNQISGLYTVNELYNLGINLSGKKPTNGYVYIYDNKVLAGCFEQGDYRLNYQNNAFKDAIEGTCPKTDGYNKVLKSYTFDYTGTEKTVTLNLPGTYILEAWGAQGGDANSTYIGGYGAYSRTEFELRDNETITLYINVGGSGKSNCNKTNCAGGYNGGAATGSGTDASVYYGGGGGATSIALRSGLLSELASYQDSILLVASGGGGASYVNNSTGNNGASGGGYNGSTSLVNSAAKLYYGTGGTQNYGGISSFANSNNGAFGLGGTFISAINNVASAGGGAGLYGGGYAGGSGSSTFASLFNIPSNSREVVTSKSIMVCYKCNENISPEYKTKSIEEYSENAVSYIPKIGNGFVRIGYVNK